MDVSMSVIIGGGKKTSNSRHNATLKEVATWNEAMEFFEREFKAYFPKYAPLDKHEEKKPKTKKEE